MIESGDPVRADTGEGQEPGAVGADIDEGGIHARHHPRDAAHIDIADQTLAFLARDDQIDQDVVLDQRGANLAVDHIDE